MDFLRGIHPTYEAHSSYEETRPTITVKYSLLFFYLILTYKGLTQTASFVTSSSGGCSPLAVNFDAASSSGTGTINYIWDFGNGNSSSGTDKNTVSAIYTQPGNYTITLTIEDNNGASAPVSETITVFDKPIADFSISQPTSGCIPYSVSLDDNSSSTSSNINSWVWDFGDGNISTDENPTHTYISTGLYDLSLIVTDANNCQGDTSISSFLEIFTPFDLDFELIPNNAATNSCLDNITLELNAMASNSPGPYSYIWDFGDGTSSTEQTPTKTYSTTGIFDIELEVTDQTTQCVVTETKTDFVELEDVNPEFSTNTNTGCVGLNVQFTNESNVIKDGQTVTWFFGDGDSLTGNATDAIILSPSHTYNSVGTFTPSIQINTNSGECIETYQLTDHIQTSTPPSVDFSTDITESCQIPTEISFSSTTNTGRNFTWDFGESETSQNENPTHSYTSFGEYSVSLEVSDSIGCTSTETKTNMILIEAPNAEFTSDIFFNASIPTSYSGDINSITGGCIPLDIEFIDLSTSPTPIVQREWTFGDGNTLLSNDSTPINTYTTTGEFQTSLTITTSDGCTNTFVCDSCAKAGNKPTALLDTSDYPIQMCCEIDHTFLNLTDTSTIDFMWYETSTGGTQSYDFDIFHLNVDFQYTDLLPVEDTNGLIIDLGFYVYDNGCMDSIDLQDWGTVFQPYVEPITIVDPCVYDPDFIIDSIYLNSNIDSIHWSFEFNNQTSNDIFPSFTSPDTTGTFTLAVTAVDQTHKYTLENGDSLCSCTIDQDFYFPGIDEPIDFEVDTIYGCVPLNIDFTGIDGYVNYNWDFGDGKTDNGQDVSSSYDTTGLFNVQLVTTDVAGCNDTISKSQFIESIGPEPAIDEIALFGCLPLPVTLTDVGLYEAPIVNRYWTTQVGDTILNDSILNHTITSTLSFPFLQKEGIDITLFVTDTNGCTNSANSKAYIGSPIPDFSFSQSPACDGDSIELTSIENDSTGFAPFTYQWNFSDGSSSNEHPSTKYFSKGNHTIELVLTDSLGCSDTSAAQIATVNFVDLDADFYANETTATCPPFIVQFYDTSTVSRSPIVSWSWELGDGSLRTIEDPATIYNDTASVDITLIVTDSLGCIDTTTKEDFIQITGVTGSFNIDNDAVCDNETVVFTASSPNGTYYTWDLGDGGFASGDTVEYEYSLSGIRFPTLVIQDSTKLCSFTYTDTINILPRPEIDLGEDSIICEGSTITIESNLVGLNLSWSTGSSSESISVSTAETIILTASDPNNNCENSDTIETFLTPIPQIMIEDSLDGCVGTEIQLNFETDKPLSSQTWSEDGTVFSTDTTATLLLDENSRKIDLLISDEYNCQQSSSTIITTATPPSTTNRTFDLCIGTEFNLSVDQLNDTQISSRYAWYRDTNFVDSSSSLTINEDDVLQLIYTTDFCTITIEANIVYHDYPVPTPHELLYFCVEDNETPSITPGEYNQYYWELTGDSTSELQIDEEGTYFVSIGNEWDCFTDDSIVTKDLCGPLVFLADAFSPNDDGINDLFDVKGRSTSSFSLTIFDRWGEIIYYTEDIDESWDGFYNNKEIPPGTYPYIVTYNGLAPLYDDQKTTIEGKVTVIR